MAGFFKKIGNFVKNFGLIGAAADLIGGRKSQSNAARMNAQNIAMQKEFAQFGIRWRVEDAKAAGLHPLYALGGQIPSFSPTVSMDSVGPSISSAGQNVQRAISATSTSEEKMAHRLAIAEGLSRIKGNEAMAAYYNSLAAREGQSQSPGIPHESEHSQFKDMGQQLPMGSIVPEAAKVIISKPNRDFAMAEGPTPLWREFNLASGMRIALPGGMQGDAAEVLESLSESWPMMYMVYQENVKRYGSQWGDEFLKRYMPFGEAYTRFKNFDTPVDRASRRFFNKFKAKDLKKFRDNFVPEGSGY